MTITKVGIELEVRMDKAEAEIKRLTAELGKAKSAAEKAGKAGKDLSKDLGKAGKDLGDIFKFNQLNEGARNIVGYLQKIDEAATRVNRYAGVMDNAAMSIDKARISTRGMVNDFELQRQANTAALLKVAQTGDEFAQLSGAAAKLGAAIGQGPIESMESLMIALGRGSTEMLDNLGIVLKVKEAQGLYAAQLGKARDQLTELEEAEAFRIIGTQKILEAADKMTVATRESADAVQQLKVELENVYDAALQWAAADIADDMREIRENGGLLGDEVLEINQALGLASERTRGFGTALADSAKKAVATANAYARVGDELRMINDDARLMAVNIMDKERLKDVERELALHGTRKDRQREVNRLLNEQAELKAKAFELEGELDKAEAARFQNELRQIRAASEMATHKGGKSKRWEGTEIGSVSSRGSLAAMAADRADFQDAMSGVEMARAGRMMDSSGARGEFGGQLAGAQMAEAGKRAAQVEKEQRRDLAEFKAELAMQEIEQQRALDIENKMSSADRLDLIDREKEARLELLEVERQATTDRLALLRLNAKETEIHHKAELAAIQEKKRAAQESMRSQIQIANITQHMTSQSVQLADLAADGFIKSEKRKDAVRKGIAGSEMIVIGITETVKAVAAFAGFNYVEGAMHVAAAALAYAKGGMLLGQAGGAGGGMSAGGGGGFGGAAFGGGADTGGSPQSSTGGGSRPESNGPVSEAEESVQRSGRGGRPGPTRNRDRDGGGATIQVFQIGQIDDAGAIKIEQALARAKRKSGRSSS